MKITYYSFHYSLGVQALGRGNDGVARFWREKGRTARMYQLKTQLPETIEIKNVPTQMFNIFERWGLGFQKEIGWLFQKKIFVLNVKALEEKLFRTDFRTAFLGSGFSLRRHEPANRENLLSAIVGRLAAKKRQVLESCYGRWHRPAIRALRLLTAENIDLVRVNQIIGQLPQPLDLSGLALGLIDLTGLDLDKILLNGG